MSAKILVVDDMPEILRMMSELLGSAGYEVVTAGSYETAKELADIANPDLILLDIRLGDYNGLQLAVRERVSHPTRPVIVMTGYVDPVLEAEAKRQGAEFIEKPIHPSRLLALIARMLRDARPKDGSSVH